MFSQLLVFCTKPEIQSVQCVALLPHSFATGSNGASEEYKALPRSYETSITPSSYGHKSATQHSFIFASSAATASMYLTCTTSRGTFALNTSRSGPRIIASIESLIPSTTCSPHRFSGATSSPPLRLNDREEYLFRIVLRGIGLCQGVVPCTNAPSAKNMTCTKKCSAVRSRTGLLYMHQCMHKCAGPSRACIDQCRKNHAKRPWHNLSKRQLERVRSGSAGTY